MNRRRLLLAVVAAGLAAAAVAPRLLGGRLGSGALPVPDADGEPEPLVVGSGERLLVIAPHPDDETIGAGGLIRRVREQGGTIRIALVTAGDGYVQGVMRETGQPEPRPGQFIAYGQRRLGEARAAMRELDGEQVRLQFLGFPDGGLDDLLRAHWQRTNPEKSRTTGASDPPYDADALEPDVPYDGADLRRELRNVIRETAPTIVAFPDPLDNHKDHHATGVFAMLALDDWLHEPHRSQPAAPRLLAYLVHWPDWPPGWNAAEISPADVTSNLELPEDLPPRGLGPTSLTLTDDEMRVKRAALARYATQQRLMPELLAAFLRRTEPFTRVAPGDLAAADSLVPPIGGGPPPVFPTAAPHATPEAARRGRAG